MERNPLVTSESISKRIVNWRKVGENAKHEEDWVTCIKADAIILVLEDIYYDLVREGR